LHIFFKKTRWRDLPSSKPKHWCKIPFTQVRKLAEVKKRTLFSRMSYRQKLRRGLYSRGWVTARRTLFSRMSYRQKLRRGLYSREWVTVRSYEEDFILEDELQSEDLILQDELQPEVKKRTLFSRMSYNQKLMRTIFSRMSYSQKLRRRTLFSRMSYSQKLRIRTLFSRMSYSQKLRRGLYSREWVTDISSEEDFILEDELQPEVKKRTLFSRMSYNQKLMRTIFSRMSYSQKLRRGLYFWGGVSARS